MKYQALMQKHFFKKFLQEIFQKLKLEDALINLLVMMMVE